MATVTTAPLDGRWGNFGARLYVEGGRGVLDLECGQLVFDRLALDARQRVTGAGRYEDYAGRPQAADRAPRLGPAKLSGKLEANKLALEVRVAGEAEPRRYALTKGLSPKIIRCM